MNPRLFPKDFLWGASTAAHQVEGNTVNQWSEWELANAAELARTAPKRLSWLPQWKRIKHEATRPENYVSGNGVDHYQRFEKDFDLLKNLNMNSFRFSVEWSRIEPKEGVWDDEGIQHYHNYISALLKRDITPVMTLWHWTVPTWFANLGGFEKKANVVYFERFVKKVTEEYGMELRFIITLNEPNVYCSLSYATGEWPPQLKKPLLAFKVYRNLVRAHKKADKVIKSIHPTINVGVAMNMSNNQAKRTRNLLSPIIAFITAYLWNRWFFNRIKKQMDFIGVNFYNTNYYKGITISNPTSPVSDNGWYMEPEGILGVLTQTYAHYKRPIIITENGVADAHDRYRRWWIEQTLVAMQRALSQGVDLRGYLHWSLLDNFEWAQGWWPKFGLISVDRQNGMTRHVRPSAKWFAGYLAKLHQIQLRSNSS